MEDQFDFRNLTDEELMSMDIEELKQLKGFLVKSREHHDAVINESEVSKSKQAIKDGLIKGNTSAALAATKGALQGITAGGVDEIDSGLAAVKDTIEATMDAVDKQGVAGFSNVLSTWKQSFDTRQKNYHKELKQLEEDHPELYTAADAAGSLALGVLTGGLGPAARIGSSLVGRIALLAGEGAVHGGLRSNSETLGGRLEGAKEGAIIGGAVGTVMGAGGKAAGVVADKVSASRFVSYLSDGFKEFSKEISGDAAEFATRMVNYTDNAGKNILKFFDNGDQALASIRNAMKETNENLGNIYKKVDDSKVLDVDSEYIFNKLKRTIVDPIADFGDDQMGSSAAKKTQNSLLKRLEQDFLMDDPTGAKLKLADGSEVIRKVPREGGLSLLNRLKNSYFDEYKLVKSSADGSNKLSLNNHIYKAGKLLSSEIDDYVSSASHKLGVEGSEQSLHDLWKMESVKFKDLLSSSKLLEDKLKNSSGKSLIRKVALDHWGKMSLGAGVAMSMYGASYTDAMMVVGSLGAIASIPTLNKAAAIGVTSIRNAIKKNPDKYANLASQLAVSMSVSSNAFYERLMEAGAEVDLSEEPMNRTTKDLIDRQDSILTVLEKRAPRQGRKFRDALRRQDKHEMALILTSTPEMKEFIAPGIGWEGKAISEEEQKEVLDYFRSNLKPRQRRKAILQFSGDLMIPQEMLTGEDPKEPEKKVIYQKVKDKFNRDF